MFIALSPNGSNLILKSRNGVTIFVKNKNNRFEKVQKIAGNLKLSLDSTGYSVTKKWDYFAVCSGRTVQYYYNNGKLFLSTRSLKGTLESLEFVSFSYDSKRIVSGNARWAQLWTLKPNAKD